GNDMDGVAPAGGAEKAGIEFGLQAGRIGNDVRHRAVFALVDHEVAHIFAEEALNLAEVTGRAGKDLGVAGPAETLVALRAVCRDFDEIAALGPERVEEEP